MTQVSMFDSSVARRDGNILSRPHKLADKISHELQQVLQRIADDVVNSLGCVGAMVAPLEAGNALPVRAYSVGIHKDLLNQLESKLKVSFLNPECVAYLDDKNFKDNLSVRAVKGKKGRPEQYLVSDSLYDLFRPIVSRPLSLLAQQLTGIKQVIAVPFFLDDEVVGNLFAASRQEFSQRDIDFLTALGHQAATAIRSQRRLADIHTLEQVVLELQASMTDEKRVLQMIVDTVVHELDYVGAMVATLETGNALPVRAYSVSMAQDIIREWENRLGVGFVSPKSIAYLDDESFKDNLSVRAVKGANGHPEKFVVSDSLYDLFRPIVPKPLAAMAQTFTGIKKVIAVPFFLEDEVVGNLFVASRRSEFSERETEILTILGQQAAVGIRNARIYRKSEERRRVSQVFADMAFNSTVQVHTLRNHIGAFRMYLQLIDPYIKQHVPEGNMRDLGDDILLRLTQAAEILDNLHEPWRQQAESLVDINGCLRQAAQKVLPDAKYVYERYGIKLHLALVEDLPLIPTLHEMLKEAFKIIIDNALEAVKEKVEQVGKGGDVWIESRRVGSNKVQITIRDSGIGIKPDNLSRIFEMRWSTKEVGMGFGLFWTKEYIEGLAGSIDADSTWNQGTTFKIILPLG
ncbi:MAG: GAF domain-containing protein [Anaerolineae bacterium]|nr:GAF domain-containing protein [Anaerolineae bacterium]